MRVNRWLLVALVMMAAWIMPSGVAHADLPNPGRASSVSGDGFVSETPEETMHYWTVARLDAARPLDTPRPHIADGNRRQPLQASPGGSTPTRGQTDRVVGTLFTVNAAKGASYCTASVVRSATRNIIMTASHCDKGSHPLFIPGFIRRRGARLQPFGAYPVERFFKYSNSGSGETAESNLDYMFARVKPCDGRQVQDRVGGFTLTRPSRYHNKGVTVFGYPRTDDIARKCVVETRRLSGYNQMIMDCHEFSGGVSGGPWITHYDARTHTGQLIGVTGGKNGGGYTDEESFAPIVDGLTMQLFRDAVNNNAPAKPAPTGPTSVWAAKDAWKHAKLTANGRFTGRRCARCLERWRGKHVRRYDNHPSNRG